MLILMIHMCLFLHPAMMQVIWLSRAVVCMMKFQDCMWWLIIGVAGLLCLRKVLTSWTSYVTLHLKEKPFLSFRCMYLDLPRGALSLGWCKFYQRASLYFQDNNSLNYFTSSWADMCTDRWPNRDWWAEWSWWMCCDELTVTGWAWLPSNNTLWQEAD